MTRTPPKTFATLIDDPLENITAFRPRADKPAASQDETRRIAEAGGFTARSPQLPTLDARSLRSRGRTQQMNISVKPETKEAFWRFAAAHGYGAGEDALLALLNLAASKD